MGLYGFASWSYKMTKVMTGSRYNTINTTIQYNQIQCYTYIIHTKIISRMRYFQFRFNVMFQVRKTRRSTSTWNIAFPYCMAVNKSHVYVRLKCKWIHKQGNEIQSSHHVENTLVHVIAHRTFSIIQILLIIRVAFYQYY